MDGEHLVLVGGRKSIADAFGHQPIQNYKFQAAAGKLLQWRANRTKVTHDLAAEQGAMKAAQLATGPIFNVISSAVHHRDEPEEILPAFGRAMKYTYNPSIVGKTFAVTTHGMKTKTVVRIYSFANGAPALSFGPAATGAPISLRLRQALL